MIPEHKPTSWQLFIAVLPFLPPTIKKKKKFLTWFLKLERKGIPERLNIISLSTTTSPYISFIYSSPHWQTNAPSQFPAFLRTNLKWFPQFSTWLFSWLICSDFQTKTPEFISSGQVEGTYPTMHKINKHTHYCLRNVLHNTTSKLLKMLEKKTCKKPIMWCFCNVTGWPLISADAVSSANGLNTISGSLGLGKTCKTSSRIALWFNAAI